MFKRILAGLATVALAMASIVGLAAPAAATQESKVEICHHDNGDPEWKLIEINENALQAHLGHQWGADIYPVPADGCPEQEDGEEDQPDPEYGEDVETDVDCQSGDFVTTTTPWTREYELDDDEWELGDKEYGDPEVVTRDATAEELSDADCPDEESDVDYVLAAWYVPGGPGSIFDPDQELITSVWLEDPSLTALDDYQFEFPQCYIQIDLYIDDATTTALLAGGILHSPNNPPEHLAFGTLGQGVNPWKFLSVDDCSDPQPDPLSGEDVKTEVDCESGKFITTTTGWTQAYVLDDDEWVLGDKEYGVPQVESRDATAEELSEAYCPPDPLLATASLAFTAASCFAAEQVDLVGSSISNATWGLDTDADPLAYSIVASASSDPYAEFADGDGDPGDLTQKTFADTLDPQFADNDERCLETLGPVQPAVSFTQITCDAAGSYTLGSSLAEDADKIVWTVNGVPNTPSGTYPVTTTMNVSVVAVAVAPDVLEFDWENPAPFAFTVAGGCDLETLALTGLGSSGWALNAGIGVLVLGAGMMLMRRREESLFD